jgi:hypothetical protein
MRPIKLVRSRFIHPARASKSTQNRPGESGKYSRETGIERRQQVTERLEIQTGLIARTHTRERTKKSVDLQSARPAAIAHQRAF